LTGAAPFKLDPGGTAAQLIPLPANEFSVHPPFALRTGDTAGTARIGTDAGGELVADVVPQTAVASIDSSSQPLDQFQLSRILITPRDVGGREILGCPASGGPSATDTASILVVTRLETTFRCELRFELAEGRAWEPTTIVIEWNGAVGRIPVDPLI
jgi:hypothetical protein